MSVCRLELIVFHQTWPVTPPSGHFSHTNQSNHDVMIITGISVGKATSVSCGTTV